MMEYEQLQGRKLLPHASMNFISSKMLKPHGNKIDHIPPILWMLLSHYFDPREDQN